MPRNIYSETLDSCISHGKSTLESFRDAPADEIVDAALQMAKAYAVAAASFIGPMMGMDAEEGLGYAEQFIERFREAARIRQQRN